MPLVLIGAVVLQPVLDGITAYHAHADLFLLVAVGAGLVDGPEWGAAWGFLAGILADLQPVTTPFGLNALVLTLVGFGIGLGSEALLRGPWWLGTAVAAAGSAAGTLSYVALAILVGQGGLLHDVRVVATVVAVVTVGNTLLSLPVLPAVRWALRRPRASPGVLA
jgi:rod shape-determining protein MreD